MAISKSKSTISITEWHDPQEIDTFVSQNFSTKLLSNVFELSPHGEQFNKDVTFKFPLNSKIPLFGKKIPGSVATLMYSPTKGRELSKWLPIMPSSELEKESETFENETGVKSWCILGKSCYVTMNHFCKVAAAEMQHSNHDNSDVTEYENTTLPGNENAGDEYENVNCNNNNNGSDNESSAEVNEYECIGNYSNVQGSSAINGGGRSGPIQDYVDGGIPGDVLSVGQGLVELHVEKVSHKMFDVAVTFKKSKIDLAEQSVSHDGKVCVTPIWHTFYIVVPK